MPGWEGQDDSPPKEDESEAEISPDSFLFHHLASIRAVQVENVHLSLFLSLSLSLSLFFFFFFFGLFRAAPIAYGSSQAKGHIGAVAAGRSHSHSNNRSELRL